MRQRIALPKIGWRHSAHIELMRRQAGEPDPMHSRTLLGDADDADRYGGQWASPFVPPPGPGLD